MVVASRLCTRSHGPICQAVSDQKKHYFIPTPLAHADNQGEGHQRGTPLQGSGKNGESSEEPSKNFVPELLSAMAAPDAEVKAERSYFEGDTVPEN
ncbi:hypothetical protein TNCV_3040881 [Trichonephila clavipes]|nr:hypothetical protein TNCV_3040881 [Trichonephila clavipes]